MLNRAIHRDGPVCLWPKTNALAVKLPPSCLSPALFAAPSFSFALPLCSQRQDYLTTLAMIVAKLPPVKKSQIRRPRHGTSHHALGHNADTFMTTEGFHLHALVFSPSAVGFYFT
jgi:hypothetical protein